MGVRSELIAAKNDVMRTTFTGCRVIVTSGVHVLDEARKAELLSAVRRFDEFNERNDPYGEHDFGKVVLADGSDYFWKFDYYDDEYVYFSEDGNRVLTIMRADEY